MLTYNTDLQRRCPKARFTICVQLSILAAVNYLKLRCATPAFSLHREVHCHDLIVVVHTVATYVSYCIFSPNTSTLVSPDKY
jgi:hypothetical protein